MKSQQDMPSGSPDSPPMALRRARKGRGKWLLLAVVLVGAGGWY